MKNWLPLTHLEQPKNGKEDYILRVLVKIPHNYEITETGYGIPCYGEEPDPEHYDNSPKICGREYTLTRIYIELEKKDGVTNFLPRYFRYKLDADKIDPTGLSLNKDCCYQVVVNAKREKIDHDGQSVGHYGDAD